MSVLTADGGAIAFRSLWTVIIGGLALVAFATSLATVVQPDPFAWFLGGTMAAGSLYVGGRSCWASVRLGELALEHRGYVKTLRLDRRAIKRVALEVVDNKIVYDVAAPVVHLEDGTSHVLTVLSSAKFRSRMPSRLQRKVDTMNRWVVHS